MHVSLNAALVKLYLPVVLFPSFLKENYYVLEPFVRLDPLLLPLLVNACRTDDLPEAFSVIPTYLSVAKILQYVRSVVGKFGIHEVCIKVIVKWTSSIRKLWLTILTTT
jgi:hypothetical protein